MTARGCRSVRRARRNWGESSGRAGAKARSMAGCGAAGTGWLLCEFGGRIKEESDAPARALMEQLKQREHPPTMRLFDDPKMEEHIWHLREEGLGATARVPGDPDNWEGWEDAAVPPDR